MNPKTMNLKKKSVSREKWIQTEIDFNKVVNKNDIIRSDIKKMLDSKNKLYSKTKKSVKSLFQSTSQEKIIELLNKNITNYKTYSSKIKKDINAEKFKDFKDKNVLKYSLNFLDSKIKSIDFLLDLEKKIERDQKYLKSIDYSINEAERYNPSEVKELKEAKSILINRYNSYTKIVDKKTSILEKEFSDLLAINRFIEDVISGGQHP